MFCGCTCIIALIFLIANIYTILSCTNDNYKQEFKNTLSNDQKITYEKIINERKNIYYSGYIFGLILSLIVILILKKFFKSKLNNLSLVCLVGTITFISNYLFYILYPKSDYMLLHLNDKTQIEGWLKIYKKMQFKFHLGFILGIIAVIIFCYSFRNN
tara:strand:- start:13 stop:486 length:474 start_codon:yes stop_codon:yes gene_type:complete